MGLARRALDLWRREGFEALARRVQHRLAGSRAAGDLVCGLDSPLPDTFAIGAGNVLFLDGWCFHPDSTVVRLQVVANGVAHPVNDLRLPRPDVLAAHPPERDPRGLSYASGFLAQVPFAAEEAGVRAEVVLQARLRDGTAASRRLGSIDLVREMPREDGERFTGPVPRLVIAMATFNSPLDLFRKQVDSIRQQTLEDWVCLIGDDCSDPEAFDAIRRIAGEDPRFRVSRAPRHLGFYGNFERCLSQVPAGAEFVALSDHDDSWHPDKLATLLSAFESDTTLVYSDMTITDEQGRVLSNTYWTTRPNQHEDLASLLMANTITGAASMFRASLLDLLLPFPQRIGDAFHDHWLACLALALGRVGYVPRPLYDYIQHDTNVLGHYAPAGVTAWTDARRLAQALTSDQPASRLRTTLAHWGAAYRGELQKVKLIARVLELRCAGSLADDKANALRRLARLGESWGTTAWLAAREAKGAGRVTPTLRAEAVLLKALAWRRYARLRRRGRGSAAAAGDAGLPRRADTASLETVRQIEQKIAPLRLRVSNAAPARVNLIIPTIDFTYFFGGYIAKLNLARKLAESGRRVRIVTSDFCAHRLALWKEQVRAFEGLDGIFDHLEVALAADRERALEVSPGDLFIATTWWTAHIAHRAAQSLGGGRFLYLIQEFEPFTFPMGTYAALARESYDFPHFAVFSTELLRDYFRATRIGVYANGPEAGDRDSVSFRNAITPVGPVTAAEITGRHPRRLLFYARPETHAARNMFELGVMGLSRAVAQGCFADGWEFDGIGAVGGPARIPLGGGAWLRLQPRQSQEEYRRFVRGHDVGLGLMYTPHPSLVPIEMASAGMLVVTNSFENKSAECMEAISRNMIVVEPTIEGVAGGLRRAAAAAGDYERRATGSNVDWSTRWDDSFDGEVMGRIAGFLSALASRRS